MKHPEVHREDLNQLAQHIWQTMFSAALELADNHPAAPPECLTASIQISGAWEGAVVLRSSTALAREVACTMLALETPEDEEICDAIGEIANLMAGAIQTLLPGSSELTPPTVLESKDYQLVFPRCSMVNEVQFTCHAEPLVVAVFEAHHEACGKVVAEPRCRRFKRKGVRANSEIAEFSGKTRVNSYEDINRR